MWYICFFWSEQHDHNPRPRQTPQIRMDPRTPPQTGRKHQTLETVGEIHRAAYGGGEIPRPLQCLETRPARGTSPPPDRRHAHPFRLFTVSGGLAPPRENQKFEQTNYWRQASITVIARSTATRQSIQCAPKRWIVAAFGLAITWIGGDYAKNLLFRGSDGK